MAGKKKGYQVIKFLYCLLGTSFGLIGLLWYAYIYRFHSQELNHQQSTSRQDMNSQKSKDSHTPSEFPREFHFVHIPKCGGTSMTAVLRQIACAVDPIRNLDCCTNPGFCDWHARRRCSVIKGCINHFPQRRYIFQPIPSITILREPISRLLSAWFYRGHSPNIDFFQVRPEFKLIKEGKAPKVTFPEYLDMIEYQNIQTRMLGADSFPYRNITITKQIFDKAEQALRAFYFIGIQEQYDLSIELLLRKLHMNITIPVSKERQQTSQKLENEKTKITSNGKLMKKAEAVNSFDSQLYIIAVHIFCEDLKKFPDLFAKLNRKKVSCGS